MANVTIKVNTGVLDAEVGASGVEYTNFSEGNDELVFSGGSDEVADGEDIPSENELVQAGIVLTGSEIVVDKYFLSDLSANELKQVSLMGNTTNQYVLAFDFDDETASEPVLEVWDDDTFQTATSTVLGGGTPSQSMIKGITTTNSAPSTDWTGNALAGATSGNFLYLNDQNGALSGADVLYCNLKLQIPSSQTTGFSANPVFVVKWLSN